MTHPHVYISDKNEHDKVIAFEKGDLLFVFNFHPSISYEHYAIGTSFEKDHCLLFTSDES